MSIPKSYPFFFSGSGGEYFRIWIVNLALTIITLGIYSAWAKVRTNRWFYGHTLLDNTPFSYLATPMQILKGRLIAAALLIAYTITSSVAPMIAGLIMLGMIAFVVHDFVFVKVAHTSEGQRVVKNPDVSKNQP